MGENLNQNPNQEINPNEKEFKFTKIMTITITVLYSTNGNFSHWTAAFYTQKVVHCRILR